MSGPRTSSVFEDLSLFLQLQRTIVTDRYIRRVVYVRLNVAIISFVVLALYSKKTTSDNMLADMSKASSQNRRHCLFHIYSSDDMPQKLSDQETVAIGRVVSVYQQLLRRNLTARSDYSLGCNTLKAHPRHHNVKHLFIR